MRTSPTHLALALMQFQIEQISMALAFDHIGEEEKDDLRRVGENFLDLGVEMSAMVGPRDCKGIRLNVPYCAFCGETFDDPEG